MHTQIAGISMVLRVGMTVGFLGLLVSPMSFHFLWLENFFSNSSISGAISAGLAEGLLMFATLVVCADTMARDLPDKRSGGKKFSLTVSVVTFVGTFIVMWAAQDHIRDGTLNGNGHSTQLLLFASAILASFVSVLTEVPNRYFQP